MHQLVDGRLDCGRVGVAHGDRAQHGAAHVAGTQVANELLPAGVERLQRHIDARWRRAGGNVQVALQAGIHQRGGEAPARRIRHGRALEEDVLVGIEQVDALGIGEQEARELPAGHHAPRGEFAIHPGALHLQQRLPRHHHPGGLVPGAPGQARIREGAQLAHTLEDGAQQLRLQRLRIQVEEGTAVKLRAARPRGHRFEQQGLLPRLLADGQWHDTGRLGLLQQGNQRVPVVRRGAAQAVQHGLVDPQPIGGMCVDGCGNPVA